MAWCEECWKVRERLWEAEIMRLPPKRRGIGDRLVALALAAANSQHLKLCKCENCHKEGRGEQGG